MALLQGLKESVPGVVEMRGFEPLASWMQTTRSPAELHPHLWWASLDSNQRPRPYQGRALTS